VGCAEALCTTEARHSVRLPSMPSRSIDDPVKLGRVLEATLLLKADLELPTLLHHVIEEARSLTGARYGALGILNEERTAIVEFITVGLEPGEEERIGPRPTGMGVLGLLIADSSSLRLAQLGSHPDSFGFPLNHPPMDSFLGVPIEVRNEVYGSLYLTNKLGSSEFTDEDEALVEALAVAAGMAIENARLHQRVQEVAVFEDRDRMARDLHDTVIQQLFAVGLSLQSMAGEARAAGMADRLRTAISEIDNSIRQVRSSIYELGLDGNDRGVQTSTVALLRELNPMVGFDVQVVFDGPVESVISDVVADHVLATIREAVTNIARHAQATEASVTLSVDHNMCQLRIVDNGRGIDATRLSAGGLGLSNLRRRAEKLHGQMEIESPKTGGTLLTWRVPVGS
jgi:signal transduction histidine kinase